MTDVVLSALRAGPVQATVLILLTLALIARIVAQLAPRPAWRKVLRILDMAVAPLFVVSVIIILQRFRDLS